MWDDDRRCTFCTCDQPAEYLLVGKLHPIPLCSHHAALVGEGEGERVVALQEEAHAEPAHLDPRRLLLAAVGARG